MESDIDYQLESPAIQNAGTKQCWWLSFLETVRRTGKLDQVFQEGPLINYPVPEEDGDKIYGPNWQKTIMAYLSTTGNWKYGPKDTVSTSSRKDTLNTLCELLNIENVLIGSPTYLLAGSGVAQTKLKALNNGQFLQVDKGTHAMTGVVIDNDGKRQLSDYNQSFGTTEMYKVQKTTFKVKSGATNTWNVISNPDKTYVLDFWLTVT